jgi:adenine-specific DNA glycosylase
MNKPSTPVPARGLARELLATYTERGLPWREPSCPSELRVLVEGLLVRTRVEAVAARWNELLGDLEGADSWLALPVDERLERAGLLGRGRAKRVLVDQLAELVVANRGRVVAPNAAIVGGEEGYCIGVYRLLLGLPAGPADSDVERIASRYGRRSGEIVAGVTSGAFQLAGEADSPYPVGMLVFGEPPATYRAFAALLDIGTQRCHSRRPPECPGCPLGRWCRRSNESRLQKQYKTRYTRNDL